MTDSAHTVRPPTPDVLTATTSTAVFDLPAGAFALADLFERVPDARAELDPTIANPADHALVVVHADDERAVDAAVRSDTGVAAVERFGERADGWAYRITWEGRPHRLIRRLVAAGVTVLSVRGQGGRWRLRVLAPRPCRHPPGERRLEATRYLPSGALRAVSTRTRETDSERTPHRMSERKPGNETKPIQRCADCNRSVLAVYLEDGCCYRCRR
jgi:hypothetical protein